MPHLLLLWLLAGQVPVTTEAGSSATSQQTPNAAAPPASKTRTAQARPRLSFAAEYRVERFRFRGDNPSNVDTDTLVPHFFEQHYRADAWWLRGTARYAVLGAAAETTIAIAPVHATRASDIDTFFDPSGDFITSGTDGHVDLWGLELDERLALNEIAGRRIGVALGLHRVHTFFPPDDIIVTHTMPASMTRTFTTSLETTVTRVTESGVMIARDRQGPRWSVSIDAAALPLTNGRLSVRLPQKYPGVDSVLSMYAFGMRGRISIARGLRRVQVGATFSAGGAWSYMKTPAYHAASGSAAIVVSVR